MRSDDKGQARLIAHLAAVERLTAGEAGSARARLEAELGSERTRFLVRALAPRARRRDEDDDLPSAASA